jgi:hypothetical protein
MDCLECENLEEVFESRVSKYNEARSAAYYWVSTELAAKKNVDMERARNDLEEHKLICIPAAEARPSGPRVARALSENRSRRLRGTFSFSHAKTISELKETKDPKLRQLLLRDMRRACWPKPTAFSKAYNSRHYGQEESPPSSATSNRASQHYVHV